MRLDTEINVQVASFAAVASGLTVTALSEAGILIHARGNIYREAGFPSQKALALAVRAFFKHLPAASAAVRAHADLNRSAENRVLLVLYSAASAATRAYLERRRILRARSAARHAGLVSGIADFLRTALYRVEEGKIYRLLDIRAARGTLLLAAEVRRTAEGVAAEHRIQYILEPAERSPSAEAAEGIAAAPAHAGVFELEIVLLALGVVRKNCVSLVYLLELFSRYFVAGVEVGVILLRKLSVRRFNFVGARLFGNPEDIVIVFICHI